MRGDYWGSNELCVLYYILVAQASCIFKPAIWLLQAREAIIFFHCYCMLFMLRNVEKRMVAE